MPNDDDSWRGSIDFASPVPTLAAHTNGTNGAAPPRRAIRVVDPGERDPRPDIPITADVHVVTEQMAVALQRDAELYVRGGALTHVIRHSGGPDVVAVVAGSPVARECPLSWLVDRVSLHAYCSRQRKTKGGDLERLHVAPPRDSVRAVLERGSWRGIRRLRAILEAPTLRPDGTVLQSSGYDDATGCLYEPSETFLPVEDAPTHSDAVAAYAHLAEPFLDFPYATEAHRSAAIAAVLTLVARASITGSVPCWVFDATAARSGKSLQVDVINAIATGRMASRTTYPETDEELEKTVSAYAMMGSPVVNFDNVARKFGGAALDKVITAVDTVDFRILGKTEIRTYEWRAIVLASGNNVAFRGDMLARVLSPRLETALENPEKRTDLRHPNLRAWVLFQRPILVHAALTMLRAYVLAGRPDMGCPAWGGFEAWARLIPHALVWVGAEDPMGARRGLNGDEDGDRACAATLVIEWGRLVAKHAPLHGLSIKGALAILYPTRRAQDPQEPDGHDDLREAIETLTNAKPGFPPSSRAMGDAIRKLKGRPFAGRKLVASSAMTGNVARWRVVAS